MAPEVLADTEYRAQPADLFGCGVVLVAMLAGGKLVLFHLTFVAITIPFFVTYLICILIYHLCKEFKMMVRDSSSIMTAKFHRLELPQSCNGIIHISSSLLKKTLGKNSFLMTTSLRVHRSPNIKMRESIS
jgi:hypothetical protein